MESKDRLYCTCICIYIFVVIFYFDGKKDGRGTILLFQRRCTAVVCTAPTVQLCSVDSIHMVGGTVREASEPLRGTIAPTYHVNRNKRDCW